MEETERLKVKILKATLGKSKLNYAKDALDYINILEKQLTLTDVSQLRELLIAYRTMIEFDVKHEDFEESVEYFLENKESYL